MNNNIFVEYAQNQGLTPLLWFNISYPTYAVKIKYSYPTSDPADFRDRALLQLIDLGIPYTTACAMLMVTDPHQTILARFKSDDHGRSLVYFNKTLNRLALTPMGKAKVERVELAKDGVACCYIDGYSGTPFPKKLVESLSDKFNYKDIQKNPGVLYPFTPDIEQRLVELNAKLNDNKDRNYCFRLGIPNKSSETSMTSLGPLWMTNLSIGIFLDNSREGEPEWIVRKIFCDNSLDPLPPFGWLENLDAFKISRKPKTRRFYYAKTFVKETEGNGTQADGTEGDQMQGNQMQGNQMQGNQIEEKNTKVFTQISHSSLMQLYQHSIKKEYGEEFLSNFNLSVDPHTGQCTIDIQHIDRSSGDRSKILSFIEKGSMPVALHGLDGYAYVKVKASEELVVLSHLRNKINQTIVDFHQIIEGLQREHPNNWRRILNTIGRHDLLFRYDWENYIKYGK